MISIGKIFSKSRCNELLFYFFLSNLIGDKNMTLFSGVSNKVNILFIEHATPEFPNGKQCLLGDMDVPLSGQSKEEAKTLRDSLEKCGIVFEAIFSSDLQRASGTAEILAANAQIPVQTSAIFRESNKGDLQGLIPEEYRKKDSYLEYKSLNNRGRFFSPMGKGDAVESKEDLAKRLIPWINQIRNDSSLRGKTIIVVTHGNPLKVLDTLARNKGSLDSPANLQNLLQDIPEYADPKSCDVYWYTADSNSFDSKGKILLKENGKTEVTSPLALR